MAGNYPDAPSWRMAYDVDGTQCFHWIDGASSLTQLSPAQIVELNDESWTTGFSGPDGAWNNWLFIFPELRDFDARYIATRATNVWEVHEVLVSTDTTNGVDGTWTSMGTSTKDGTLPPVYRTDFVAATALGIKAVKVRANYGGAQLSTNIQVAHLFGEPAPGENLQRLEIWHPTLDQRLGPADLDWGDVPRNSSEIRSFRIKNMHPTLTANSVRAAMSILTDTTPSVVGQMSISKDGGSTWGAQQTLTSPLGPEAISPVLQIRRQTPANATLSLWWYRVFANCSSWT